MSKMFTPSAPAAVAAPVAAPIPAATPVVVPVQDESATATAKKKAMASQQQRGGVASTVLSDTLGG